VRGSELRFDVVDATATELRARLPFDAPGLLAVFPFPHELEVRAALSPGALRVETTLRPTADAAVPVSFGYHPYLTLPGVARVAWEIGLPACRRILLDDRQVPTDGREEVAAWSGPLGDRTFDDGYDRLEDPVFTLRAGGRALAVRFLDGYTHAQVFAPPGQDLIAFEPMTAPADALNSGAGLRLVAPGEAFAAVFEISVS
jgi:galactose mutarotase-like enzyme